jgi:hypothetical protein
VILKAVKTRGHQPRIWELESIFIFLIIFFLGGLKLEEAWSRGLSPTTAWAGSWKPGLKGLFFDTLNLFFPFIREIGFETGRSLEAAGGEASDRKIMGIVGYFIMYIFFPILFPRGQGPRGARESWTGVLGGLCFYL